MRAHQLGGRGVVAGWSELCAVAPSPQLKEQWKQELALLRSRSLLGGRLSIEPRARRLGYDDGLIIPPVAYPLGTPIAEIRDAAALRAPLRGEVRVVVVVVDFSDAPLATPIEHYADLFFSSGVLPHGSVREYFQEVASGAVDLAGEVAGPFRMPRSLRQYANDNFGLGDRDPTDEGQARQMALHAAIAADEAVDYSRYDNDGNGYVDAFIVVHAGPGAEVTGNPNHLWSHKWVLPAERVSDQTRIYGYLTIPEDSKIGVCAHELGHLLFGFPDLYDTDSSSEGVGNWCLMGAGSWNGGGDIPAHPSAWCKVAQGWVRLDNVTESGLLTLQDVKQSKVVHRVWRDGALGPEYFLLENRQRTGYDAELPGEGLLVWHIDETAPDNTNENRYRVALVQADALRDLEHDRNRGDAGDAFPGTADRRRFDATTTPSSRAYSTQDSCVALRDISDATDTMTLLVETLCRLPAPASEP